MNPSKPWYASAGVWGAIVTLAGSGLALLKVELDPALLADVRDWVLSLATLIGGGVALWGRVRASRTIAPVPRHSAPIRRVATRGAERPGAARRATARERAG